MREPALNSNTVGGDFGLSIVFSSANSVRFTKFVFWKLYDLDNVNATYL